jgi:dTMP kinase
MLAERARDAGLHVSFFSFPLYDGNPFSGAVSSYLNGAFGTVDEVHPELAGLLYACDRFHAQPALTSALARDDLVVCDRYVPSNLAHQGAKLNGPARTALVDWLLDVEYGEFGLPQPDLVVLIDIAPDVARERVQRKAPRAYTDLSHDIHEAALEYLETVRAMFLDIATSQPQSWYRVSATDNEGRLREVSEMSEEIWDAVCRLLPH